MWVARQQCKEVSSQSVCSAFTSLNDVIHENIWQRQWFIVLQPKRS